jgi:hypothetical protein
MTVSCQLVRERDFRLIGRWIVDASPDGLLVATDLLVLTGEPVLVSFKAPFSEAWIDAEATVARVVHGRRPGDRGRRLGIQLDYMEPRARAHFEGQLGWFRESPARAR